MAENDNSSMIGYDPLAWLHEDEQSAPIIKPDQLECTNTVNDDQPQSIDDLPLESIENLSADTVDDRPLELNEHNSVDSGFDEGLSGDAPLIDLQNSEHLAPVAEPLDTTGNLIVLEPIQNIQNIVSLHQRLQQVLDSQEKLDVDASAVAQIDTATLQLLLVLKLTAVKSQKQVNIDFPSQKFIDAAYLLGLAEMLSVDKAASGLF